MLTIIDCGVRRGFSGRDHWINDGPAKGAIGSRCRNVRTAARLVARLADAGIPERVYAPVWLKARTDDGDIVEFFGGE